MTRPELRSQLVRQVSGNGALTAGELVLSLAIAILLARLLGLEGLGVYSLAFSLVALATLPIEFGLPTLLTREVAGNLSTLDWPNLRGVILFSLLGIVVLSLIVSLSGFAVLAVFKASLDVELAAALRSGLLLPPLVGMLSAARAILAGHKFVLLGQIPRTLIRPGGFALCLATVALVAPDWLSPARAMLLQVGVAAIACCLAVAFVLVRLTPAFWRVTAVYRVRPWLASSIRLGLFSSSRFALPHAVIVLTGGLVDEKAVGLLRVAQRGAGVVALASTAIAQVMTPYVASLYASAERDRLQKLLTRGAQGMTAGTGAFLLVIALYGRTLIEVLFGPEFIGAYAPLLVLGATQLLLAFLGTGAILLNMTRHDAIVMRASLVSLALTLFFCLPLLPAFGALGAASAIFAGSLFFRLYLWRQARIRLELRTSAIGV